MVMAISVFLGIVVTAVLLKIVAMIVPNLEIEGFGQALITAALWHMFGLFIGFVLTPLNMYLKSPWTPPAMISFGLSCVTAVIALTVASNSLPGVKVKGAGSLVLAAVLLEVLQFAWGFLMRM